MKTIGKLEDRLMKESKGRAGSESIGKAEFAPGGWHANGLTRSSNSSVGGSAGAKKVIRNFSRPFRQQLPPILFEAPIKKTRKRLHKRKEHHQMTKLSSEEIRALMNPLTEIPPSPDTPLPELHRFEFPDFPTLSDEPPNTDTPWPLQCEPQFPAVGSRRDTPRPGQSEWDIHDASGQPVTLTAMLTRLSYAKPRTVTYRPDRRNRPASCS